MKNSLSDDSSSNKHEFLIPDFSLCIHIILRRSIGFLPLKRPRSIGIAWTWIASNSLLRQTAYLNSLAVDQCTLPKMSLVICYGETLWVRSFWPDQTRWVRWGLAWRTICFNLFKWVLSYETHYFNQSNWLNMLCFTAQCQETHAYWGTPVIHN